LAYRNPVPTVDVLLQTPEGLVLIRRSNPPEGWALPGGFVDYGERVEDAAVREALEETGLHIVLDDLFYVYSDPRRDPRQHTLTVVFISHASGPPIGGDDAAEARAFPLDALPSPLVFDHGQIVADYKVWLETGRRPVPLPRPVDAEG
jgi:8-oxo-dGTP diphosphatase